MTHDHDRDRNTKVFAALDVMTGMVIGGCPPRQRAVEFLRSLHRIDGAGSGPRDVQPVLDNPSAL